MAEPLDLTARIAEGGFDFLDFGCSGGASLKLGRSLFGGKRGLGIDIDARKVEAARTAGLDAMLADASALTCRKNAVSFVTMLHFLEHLPGTAAAEACMRSAIRAARDFVYVRHPWFDADFDLYRLGCKFYWSDWNAHPTHLGVLQMDNILRRIGGAQEWVFFGRGRIRDLSAPAIVPLDAPRNGHALEGGNGLSGELPFLAYAEFAALIRVGEAAPFEAARAVLTDHEPLERYSAAAR